MTPGSTAFTGPGGSSPEVIDIDYLDRSAGITGEGLLRGMKHVGQFARTVRQLLADNALALLMFVGSAGAMSMNHLVSSRDSSRKFIDMSAAHSSFRRWPPQVSGRRLSYFCAHTPVWSICATIRN
jgi:hypothetical protein